MQLFELSFETGEYNYFDVGFGGQEYQEPEIEVVKLYCDENELNAAVAEICGSKKNITIKRL